MKSKITGNAVHPDMYKDREGRCIFETEISYSDFYRYINQKKKNKYRIGGWKTKRKTIWDREDLRGNLLKQVQVQVWNNGLKNIVTVSRGGVV